MLWLYSPTSPWFDFALVLLSPIILPIIISLCYERQFKVGKIFFIYSIGFYALAVIETFAMTVVFRTLNRQGIIIIYIVALFISYFVIRLVNPTLKRSIRKFNSFITKGLKTFLIWTFYIITAVFSVEFAFMVIPAFT